MLRRLLDRPVAVTMGVLVVLILGLVSLRQLPVSLIPEVDIPYITVQAAAVSLSAREIEESVVKPLREQLIQVNGLEDLVAESKDGSGVIRLSFPHGADMDFVFIEVNEKIDRAMAALPRIDRPRVFRAGAGDLPTFFVDVTRSDGGDFLQLSRFCREVIARRIEQLPEVAMADISGTVEEQILVLPREDKLFQAGMTLRQFEDAIASANIRIGALTIRDGAYRYQVKFDARIGGPEDIAAIWLKCGDRLLQVGDLADVTVTGIKRTGGVRSNGEAAVTLAVIKQSETRMSRLKEAIGDLLNQFEQDYPQLSFKLTRDQTALLAFTIRNLFYNIILGILLAGIVIFLFLKNIRNSALVFLTMPTALVFSMLLFRLVGLSLNIISLSGLLLGVGMMADNSIILIDNITARWQRKENLRDAVLEGTWEVMGPMLSSVLTTCAVFMPLIFVRGMAGALFYEEAMAITLVLGSSYLVTVIVIPVYYYWWYKSESAFHAMSFMGRFSLEGPLLRWDERRINWWLDHGNVAWLLIGVSAVGAISCFVGMERQRLPDLRATESILKVDWNDRLSFEENERRTAVLENLLKEDALQFSSLVGEQQFVLRHSGEQGGSETQVYFRCPDGKSLEVVQSGLSAYLNAHAPDAIWHFEPAGNIFDQVFARTEAPIVAKLRPVKNPEVRLETLRPIVASVRERIPQLSVPPVSARTDILFTADPEKMALYDISYNDLVLALRTALNENRIFDVVQGTRILPVVTGVGREDLSRILSETFIESDKRQIPVSVLMRQDFTEDLKTIVSGSDGNYYPLPLQVDGRNAVRVMNALREVIREDGAYDVSFDGSWFSNRQMAWDLFMVLLVAVALLYLILSAQFESLLQPVIILLEIVVDIFGALLVLWVMDVSLNLMSLIGLVVVTGIVINDSILKIDTINRLESGGMELRRAVLMASRRRFKAIVMTSLTTILAVAPFLSRGSMGADLQYPLSLVIIVGMSVGTLVSLFIVPSLYYSIHGKRRYT
ncbi:MAG: efflux RND transporter permease subunit [Bacteroidales bacterium]|nr:efflux RND transporter permease subunit [Bacteroidales bacterium]